MQTLRLFKDAPTARNYRRDNGTGGWIFDSPEMVILFPPELTPTGILNHPVTKGRSGKLLAN